MAYWLVMLAQVALAQEIFPAARMGQFSSANVVLQSVVIALLTTPATGWLLDTLKGVDAQVALPWGTVVIGSYRFSFLVLALVYAAALFCTVRTKRCWLAHGGPKNYLAPFAPASFPATPASTQ
jgi:hypothetical protein